MPMGFILSLFIVGVFIGGIFLILHLREKKRTEKMGLVAAEMGLPFYAHGDDALVSELSNFHLFLAGRSKKIRNVLHGVTSDVDVAIFDYQYTTDSGKHSTTYKQTVACFRSADLACPEFALRPENIFDKIGGAFGFQDIDFESHPTFSNSYLLRSDSEHRVRKLFTDEVLAFFAGRPGLSVEASGQRVIFYRTAKRVKPEEVSSFLKEGFHVYSLFKNAARRE